MFKLKPNENATATKTNDVVASTEIANDEKRIVTPFTASNKNDSNVQKVQII